MQLRQEATDVQAIDVQAIYVQAIDVQACSGSIETQGYTRELLLTSLTAAARTFVECLQSAPTLK